MTPFCSKSLRLPGKYSAIGRRCFTTTPLSATERPNDFRANYDDFLSSTGMADAVTLGKRFGADVQSVVF
jgi:hypothetical protein